MAEYSRQYELRYPEYAKLMKRKSYLKRKISLLQAELVDADDVKKLLIESKITYYTTLFDNIDSEIDIAREKYGIEQRK